MDIRVRLENGQEGLSVISIIWGEFSHVFRFRLASGVIEINIRVQDVIDDPLPNLYDPFGVL